MATVQPNPTKNDLRSTHPVRPINSQHRQPPIPFTKLKFWRFDDCWGQKLERTAGLMVMIFGLCACAVVPDQQWPNAFVDLIQRSSAAVVGIGDGSNVVGSGFRIKNTHMIATAAHVVNALGGRPIVVWNSIKWDARLTRIDKNADLALLEIEENALIPGLALAAADQMIVPGQWVLVMGCPFGTLPTATLGIISALPGAVLRPAELKKRIQLNAAVNPGNSGGPVLSLDGKVIGVANATISGGYGLGFAVPVAELTQLIVGDGF